MGTETEGQRTFPAGYLDDVIKKAREMADTGSTPDQIATFVEVALCDCRPTAADIALFVAEMAKSNTLTE